MSENRQNMAYLPLLVAISLISIDALIEVGFVGSMVGYLHHAHADVPFTILNSPQNYQLFPKPAQPIVNQGHTSNGAAGTAFVLVGVCGFITIWRQRKLERFNNAYRPSRIFTTWAVFTLLSFLLTLSALIYTFVVTHNTDNQTIDPTVAAANNDKPYPVHQWTPENWYKAVLKLPFQDESEKSNIRFNVHLMEGWRWNLIPLLLLGLSVLILATRELLRIRRAARGTTRDRGSRQAFLGHKGQA